MDKRKVNLAKILLYRAKDMYGDKKIKKIKDRVFLREMSLSFYLGQFEMLGNLVSIDFNAYSKEDIIKEIQSQMLEIHQQIKLYDLEIPEEEVKAFYKESL